MAERRMFSKGIVSTDFFLEMPLSSQALYFHLGLEADDDGFVSSPKKIQKSIGAADDDFKLLISKGYVIPFDSGIIVITHWNISNNVRKDRKKETIHQYEKGQIFLVEGGIYSLNPPTDSQLPTDSQPTDDQMGAQYSIGKDSIGKGKKIPPSIEEVHKYISEKGYDVDAERWYDFYAAKGWMIGKNKMKDWKAAVRTWAKRDENQKKKDEPPAFKEIN